MPETPVPTSAQQEERTRAEAEIIAARENRTVQEVQAELLAAEQAGGTVEEKAAAKDTEGKQAEAAVEATPKAQMEHEDDGGAAEEAAQEKEADRAAMKAKAQADTARATRATPETATRPTPPTKP